MLQPDRERLIKEREQFDAIKKRIADLEAKINGFNDEVKKLNEEEKAIIDSSVVK